MFAFTYQDCECLEIFEELAQINTHYYYLFLSKLHDLTKIKG